MATTRSLLACMLVLAAGARAPAAVFSPLDYGAAGDGATNDGPAVQKAIDAAHAAGGGIVAIPAGRTLLSGSIELKSNVTLRLEPDSRLLGSARQADYREPILVGARHADNIAITGTGCIDGQGLQFMESEGQYIFKPKAWRPRLVLLEDCRHVRVSDVGLREAAFWSLHLAGCEDVAIERVSIRNSLKTPNCDGIDPDDSRNVRISDCSVECGDDAIVVKTSREFARYGPCENITVSHCVLTTHDCALKIGSETAGAIRHVVFADCTVNECNRGVGIVLRDEGDVEDVVARDIEIHSRLHSREWWGASEAVYVSAHPRLPGGRVGHLRGLRFSRIVSNGEAGVFIQGSPQCIPEDIVLEDIKLDIAKTTPWPSRFDLRPPEELGVEEQGVTIAGIRLQDARGIRIRRCSVRWGAPAPESYGAVLWTQRVGDLELDDFHGSDAHQP